MFGAGVPLSGDRFSGGVGSQEMYPYLFNYWPFVLLRNSHINHLHSHGAGLSNEDQNVLRLDVSVSYIVFMHILEECKRVKPGSRNLLESKGVHSPLRRS